MTPADGAYDDPVPRRPRRGSDLLPGLAYVGVAVAVGFLIHAAIDVVSPLVVALVIGVALGNLGRGVPEAAVPGITFAARHLLRLGIVLLGVQISFDDVIGLGGRELAIIIVVVVATFLGTLYLGRLLGVTPGLRLLLAAGYAICGVSAVVAMEQVSDASDEEVTFAIALVTLFGSLAIVVLPPLGDALGLNDATFGSWVGASVHDVAQVVATAHQRGDAALETAVVVKLTRVLLLAPIVASVGLLRRRNTALAAPAAPSKVDGRRPPLVPLFVIGFLVAAALRSSGALSPDALSVIKTAQVISLAAALCGLGTYVRFRNFRALSARSVALALAAWMFIAVTGYVGVVYL